MINYITSWDKNKYIFKESDSADVNDPNKVSSSIYYGQIMTEGEYIQDYPEGVEPVKMRVFHLYPDNVIQRESLIGNNVYEGAAMAFNAKSENVERVLMFFDWIQQSQENYELFMYGIKDRDYIIKKGMITLTEGIKYEDSPYMYWWENGNFRNIEYERFPDEQEVNNSLMMNMQSYIDYIKTKTKYPLHEGFYPDYSSVQVQADNRAKAFSRNVDHLLGYSGSFDPLEVDNLIKEFKDAGADRIVEEVQKQLDEWRNENKK